MMSPVCERKKQAVADSFSRAADTYDSVAQLQRQVGEILQQHIVQAGLDKPARLVDLGCGTGYFTDRLATTYPDAHIIGLDLAGGMLAHAKAHRHPRLQWLGGDMEQLPFAAHSVDAMFTSLALQWCEDLPAFFRAVHSILTPGGWLALCTLGPSTLHELRSSWAQVDDYVHVNQFDSAEHLRRCAAGAGLVEVQWRTDTVQLHYARLGELTHELKALGAHNVNEARAQGLTAPSKLRALTQAYERFRTPSGLPASYEVYWLLLKKAVPVL